MLRLHPESPQIHFQLALVRERRQELDKAIEYYRRTIALKPDYAPAHFALGLQYMRKGEKKKAILHYQEGLNSDPIYIPAINNMAWILATSSNPSLRNGPEAVRRAEHAAAADGYSSLGVLDTLAAAYAEAGDFPAAVHWQTKALELAPKSFNAQTFQSQLKPYKQSKPYREPTGKGPNE